MVNSENQVDFSILIGGIMLNKVLLIGRLGKKPELKVSVNGKTYCVVGLATSKFDSLTNDFVPTWHNLIAWNKTAEKLGTFEKGDQIYVDGEINVSEYKKDGNDLKSYQIICYHITRVGSKLDNYDNIKKAMSDTERVMEKKSKNLLDDINNYDIQPKGDWTSDEIPF